MIVSQVLGSGVPPLTAQAIGGDGRTGLTAVGATQATALQLPASQNQISTAAAGTGAKLPPIESGSEIWVRNDGANAALIYPFEAAGVTVNGGASFSVGAAKTTVFKAFSSTAWFAVLTA